METPSKRTIGCDEAKSGGPAGWPMGFLDMSAEIGDLEELLLGVRFGWHDTDLSELRHRLFGR
jgi:hypothetical protein